MKGEGTEHDEYAHWGGGMECDWACQGANWRVEVLGRQMCAMRSAQLFQGCMNERLCSKRSFAIGVSRLVTGS